LKCTQDSSGNYGIVYPWAGSSTFTIKRALFINDTLRITDTLVITDVYVGHEQQGTHISGQRGGAVQRGCNNEFYATWSYQWSDYWKPYESGIHTRACVIGSDGKRLQHVPNDKLCKMGGRLIVTRLRFDTVSSIVVEQWDSIGVVTPMRFLRESREEPKIVELTTGLYVTWRENSGRLHFPLFHWPDPRSNLVNKISDFLLPFNSKSSSSANYFALRHYGDQDGFFLQYAKASSSYGPDPFDWHMNSWRGVLYQSLIFPSDTGWKSIFTTTTSGAPGGSPVSVGLFDVGESDVNSGEVLISEYGSSYAAINSNGKVAWSIGALGYRYGQPYMFAAGKHDVIILKDDILGRIRNGIGDPYDTLTSSFPPSPSSYQRLRDSSFMAWRIITPGDTLVHLRRYTFSGELLRDTVITFSVPINKIVVRLNSHDSALVFLCATSKGIRMTYLDKELNLHSDSDRNLLHDLHINAEEVTVRNVSGIFRNDTLLMVWEDYRHGDSIPDVYGNFWVVPKLLAPGNDDTPGNPDNPVDTSSISIISLAPNPTRGVVAISVQSTETAETQLDVYEVMGGRVWQSKALSLKVGRNDFTVDTKALGLPTGSYIITVQSGNHIERRKLIVLHQ
jgi:hypothetical protein